MLSIGDVARRAGLATSAIRYYEAEGLIPEAPRSGGQRVYDDTVFDHLMLIRVCRAAGFTLPEIKAFKAGLVGGGSPGPRWRELAAAKAVDLERQIEELNRMKTMLQMLAACACPTLGDCRRVVGQGVRPDVAG